MKTGACGQKENCRFISLSPEVVENSLADFKKYKSAATWFSTKKHDSAVHNLYSMAFGHVKLVQETKDRHTHTHTHTHAIQLICQCSSSLLRYHKGLKGRALTLNSNTGCTYFKPSSCSQSLRSHLNTWWKENSRKRPPHKKWMHTNPSMNQTNQAIHEQWISWYAKTNK